MIHKRTAAVSVRRRRIQGQRAATGFDQCGARSNDIAGHRQCVVGVNEQFIARTRRDARASGDHTGSAVGQQAASAEGQSFSGSQRDGRSRADAQRVDRASTSVRDIGRQSNVVRSHTRSEQRGASNSAYTSVVGEGIRSKRTHATLR